MERDQITFHEQPIKRYRLRPHLADRAFGHGRIADEHLAAEGDEPADDAAANATGADNAAGHGGERAEAIDAGGEPPAAAMDFRRMRNNLPRQGENEGQSVVGDLVDAVVGDIADGDATGFGRLAVDVVVADPVADDRLRPSHGGDDVGSDRGELRDHGISIGHRGGENDRIFGARIDDRASGPLENRPFEIDVVERPIGDHNLHESPPASPVTPEKASCRQSTDSVRGV